MNTTCPICGKAVDPLRSRHVGVRAGKVVAYCSAEHAREGETKPTAMPVDPPKLRTPAGGVPKVTVGLDSGPVIEIIHEPASGVVRADKTPLPTKSAKSPKPATIEAAPTTKPLATADVERDRSGVRIADFEERRQREQGAEKSPYRTLVIAAIVLVLGGGAFGVYRLVLSKPSSTPVSKPTQPVVPVAVPDAAPAKQDPSAAVAQAETVLRANLASESPRVQRVAAEALARTQDKVAIDALAVFLGKETVDIAKLDIAYALARGGDDRGRAALVAGLGSGRRDVKLEASRRLALLGDPKAAPTLTAYLEVSQLRLGAAEQLAYLKDAKAIETLDAIRADAKTSRDEHARATIALGTAGRKDVIPDLQKLLEDSHFKTPAAQVLAGLGDPTARAVLAEQLAVPSLRVDAARGLRRLDPGLDPAPLLTELVAALGSHKDTEQVQIAEAILILAGELTWSERP